ncbi:hypothetical protein RB595_001601 [Gaeumannomyces hyphopodioides]
MLRPVLKRWGPLHLCAINRRGQRPPPFLVCSGAVRASLAQRGFVTCEARKSNGYPKVTSPRTRHRRFKSPDEDTIYALSSAHGRAGVAVIRLSGPDCLQVYQQLCPGKEVPEPRYAVVRALYEPTPGKNSDVLDSAALVLFFPGPKSVTGEDVLELHTHGGTATVRAVLSAIVRCRACNSTEIRYADPGEFTRRAFFNGRLDLAQVESLGDALDAETEQQRRAAVRGCSGALGRSYESWRRSLLHARAELEALIDFSEDQHFDESPRELLGNVARLARETLRSIGQHEAAGQRAELLRKGVRVALVGPPNAGKSSLMNLIVGREASIVSTEAGTTRDVVEASLDIRGYLCTFADTAGFRCAAKPDGSGKRGSQQLGENRDATLSPSSSGTIGLVEQEGIRRARAKAEDSDVVIALASIEPVQAPGSDGARAKHRIQYDEETLRLAAQAHQRIVVVNKRELVSTSELNGLIGKFKSQVLARFPGLHTAEPLAVSCRECADASGDHGRLVGGGRRHAPEARTPGQATIGLTATAAAACTQDRDADPGSVQALVDGLARSFESLTSLPPDMQDLLGVTERQRQLLARCRDHLEDFLAEAGCDLDETAPDADQDPDVVLAAEHLRYAANTLASITGDGDAGDVEEVLGVIFEKFCVGK